MRVEEKAVLAPRKFPDTPIEVRIGGVLWWVMCNVFFVLLLLVDYPVGANDDSWQANEEGDSTPEGCRVDSMFLDSGLRLDEIFPSGHGWNGDTTLVGVKVGDLDREVATAAE